MWRESACIERVVGCVVLPLLFPDEYTEEDGQRKRHRQKRKRSRGGKDRKWIFFSQKSEKRRGEEGAELADVSFAANFFQLKAKKKEEGKSHSAFCDTTNV